MQYILLCGRKLSELCDYGSKHCRVAITAYMRMMQCDGLCYSSFGDVELLIVDFIYSVCDHECVCVCERERERERKRIFMARER